MLPLGTATLHSAQTAVCFVCRSGLCCHWALRLKPDQTLLDDYSVGVGYAAIGHCDSVISNPLIPIIVGVIRTCCH